MNNIEQKTVRDRFVAVAHPTIKALAKINCIACYTLYFFLSSKQTFVNGLVGVFDELTIYDVSKYLTENLGKKIDTTSAKYYLNKLEKNLLIRIHHLKPLIILLTQAEFSEDLKTLDEVFDYVKKNEQEFNFHVHKRRATEFYATFKLEPLPSPPLPSAAKAEALDTLIQSRPTRAPASPTELKAAEEWRETIAEDEDDNFDPFAEHIAKNNKRIQDEIRRQKEWKQNKK